MVNFFLLIVYWHFYWHVEEEFNSARKVRTDRVQESHAKRTAAGVRRAPITTEIAAQRSPAQTVVQKPLTNGTTAVHQSNGHVHTTSTISLPTNGHVPNGRAAAIANAMRTSPPRISNGFAPITLLPDGEGGVLRRSSAESPLGSAATTSSGCSSSTPRRRLPVVNTPVGGPVRANGRPMNAPSTQLSTMSLPIGPRLPESQRTASGLGFAPAAVVRTDRRPSSARTEANEWAPSPAQPPAAYHVLPPAHLPAFTNSPPAPHLRSMRRYQSAGNWQRPYASPLLHDDRRLPDVAESDLLTPSPITPLAVQRGSLPFGYANEFVPPPPPATVRLLAGRLAAAAGGATAAGCRTPPLTLHGHLTATITKVLRPRTPPKTAVRPHWCLILASSLFLVTHSTYAFLHAE
ncbi:hypothetical protein M3Y99_01260700 [Aphelenchoides fujianensis]|nr:hypothetical protein M3Y99_01260700 [Aphelenchoides fujianensis]